MKIQDERKIPVHLRKLYMYCVGIGKVPYMEHFK